MALSVSISAVSGALIGRREQVVTSGFIVAKAWVTLVAFALVPFLTACSTHPAVQPDRVDALFAGQAVRAADSEQHVPAFADGEQEVAEPFEGVQLVRRETSVPRPLIYNIVVIDMDAPGIDFMMTAANADEPREVTRETTVAFAERTGVQLAINAHFFRPWPTRSDYVDLGGLAASDGDVYSECSGEWSQALVVSTEGHASIEDCADLSREVLANADDAMGSNERIVRDGENTATWRELHPRTAIGVTGDEELVLVVVDGRQRGYSEGMTTPEVAEVMLDFGVVDAINLDGGGSTTLVINRGEPLVINRPVGRRRAGTLREVGSSFGVFAGPNR